MAVMIAV